MISILVPVLGREHQIEPLLDSIEQNTLGEHVVTFICSPSDPTREACLASRAATIVVDWEPGQADFAKKINLAYAQLEPAEWYFQAATDLVFHPDWLARAMQVAQSGRFGVIGTNDLGNPLVKRGHHSTHIIFSREYIETFGGTWDNTGAVFCELYDHQFVDTEFVQTALLRRQFRPALRSVVEHMHPHWGKGARDETYEKSERNFLADARLHNMRLRQMRRLGNQARRAR